MKNIVLLMCGKNKFSSKTRVKDLYISERFQKSIEYARQITSEDNIFVLSAKHGLLELEKEIEPYDKSIYNMDNIEKIEWANNVINQLEKYSNINEDKYIFLTDNFYCQDIYKNLINYELPLNGLSNNDHKKWFIEKIKNNE